MIPNPISVVIPLYNKAAYVARAVTSVLSQTRVPREVIVVDDGSTDDGARIVDGLGSSIVRTVRQPNQGPGVARNTGLLHASGDWVALLDADDVWLPNHLEEIAQLIATYPDAALVSTRYTKAPAGTIGVLSSDTSVRQRREINYFMEGARDRGIVSSSTCALKRHVANGLGGFGSYRYGEDVAFWARVALDYKIVASDRVTAVYVRNTGGPTELRPPEADTELSSISAVGPVFEVLEVERNARGWKCYPREVREFMDSWLLVYLRSNVYKRNFRRAHSIAEFMTWQWNVAAMAWRTAALFPGVLSAALRTRDRLRRHA